MATTIQIYGTLPGGGGTLQEKTVTITENGELVISPDSGFDGLSKVNLTTQVEGNTDFIKFTQGDENLYLQKGDFTEEDIEALQDFFDEEEGYENAIDTYNAIVNSTSSTIMNVASDDNFDLSTFVEFLAVLYNIGDENMQYKFINDDGNYVILTPTSENSMDVFNLVDTSDLYYSSLMIEEDAGTGDLSLHVDAPSHYIIEFDLQYITYWDGQGNGISFDFANGLITSSEQAQLKQLVEENYGIIWSLYAMATTSSANIESEVQSEVLQYADVMLQFAQFLYGMNLSGSPIKFLFNDGYELELTAISASSFSITNKNDSTDMYTYIFSVSQYVEEMASEQQSSGYEIEITDITQIGGGSGGDYSNLGYGIDVEAQTTINKGDKIIAIENSEYVAPTLSATQTQGALWSISADNSVGIEYSGGNSASITSGSTINVWFRNEESGQFDTSYQITFADYPLSQKCYPSFVMNEDGTLAYTSAANTNAQSALYYDNVVIVLEIDKENKTATYRYLSPSFDNLLWGGSSSSNYKVLIDYPMLNGQFVTSNSAGSRGTNGVAVGDYVICKAAAHGRKAADDTFYSIQNILCVIKYDRTTHQFSLKYYTRAGDQASFILNGNVIGNGVKINDNEIIFHIGQYLFKYDTQNDDMSYGSSTGISFCPFSSNGKYVATVSGTSPVLIKVYEVSFLDLTLTLKYDKSYTSTGVNAARKCAYVSNDGRYVYTTEGAQLFDMVTDENYRVTTAGNLNSNQTLPSGFFDTHNMIQMSYNSSPYPCYIFSLTPGTDAEYLASKYESYTGNDSAAIYGIASEDLVVGQRGEARATNTVQQKTVTIEGASATITPDTGYDTMNVVNVISSFNAKFDISEYTFISHGRGFANTIKELDFSNTAVNYAAGLFKDLYSLQKVNNFSISNSCQDLTQLFYQCEDLIEFPNIDTSNVSTFKQMCGYCTSLEDVPVLNMQRAGYGSTSDLLNMFGGCSNLTDTSLNNILASLLTIGSYYSTGTKTLSQIGLSQTQAETCTTLSNWSALSSAGWTTGY